MLLCHHIFQSHVQSTYSLHIYGMLMLGTDGNKFIVLQSPYNSKSALNWAETQHCCKLPFNVGKHLPVS